MDPVTIITTVVTLSKALMAGIDVISTIMEQKKFESVILQVYTTHIHALVRDLRTIKRQINALGWVSAEADRVPDITVEWDNELQACWSDIKEAEEELTGYLEHFKAIVSWIIDNGLTWRTSPRCRKQKYDEVGHLMGQIVFSRRSITLSLNCIAAIQNRRPSCSDGSTIPLLPPTPRPSITSIDAGSIHPSSLRRPSSAMPLSPGSSTSPLITQPMEMRRPSTLSLPSPPSTPTPRPSLKLLSCRSLRLSNYLPRTHRSFDFIRISPSGNYIALLTRRGYSILNLRYQNPQTSPTAIVIRIGPDKLSNSKPALAHFGCAAINDECLVVGTPQAGELLVVPFKTDQQPFKLPIACDAIVLMEFSPTGKELLVLGRSSDWKIQSAFIFTVDYESRDGRTVLNLGLCGEPFKWEERKGRCQTIASWSQGSKFIAISSTTAANGKVQIRLLTKRSNGKKGWCQRLQPKEILVENVQKQDCRPDCKITAHSFMHDGKYLVWSQRVAGAPPSTPSYWAEISHHGDNLIPKTTSFGPLGNNDAVAMAVSQHFDLVVQMGVDGYLSYIQHEERPEFPMSNRLGRALMGGPYRGSVMSFDGSGKRLLVAKSNGDVDIHYFEEVS